MSKRLALIISTETHQDKQLARLKLPRANVLSLISVLNDPLIGNFSTVETAVDRPVTEIRRHIDTLFYRRKQYDLILLYFLGHGVFDKTGQLYLATADTRLDTLEETALPATYITDCMDRCFSRQQILVLDCHHTRLLGSDTNGTSHGKAGIASIFEGSGYRRVVMAATDAIQYTIRNGKVRGDPDNSVFTHYLIHALRTGTADVDGDEQTGVSELFDYVHDEVVKHTVTYKPRKWTYQSPDKFILARNPRSVIHARPIKWDLVFGAVMAPLTTIIIGAWADVGASVGLAGMFLLLYACLYLILD